ncbi:MAG: FtsX-like permease family protein [Actinobacteria bacterium]|nr:FtsX-like permease family protein [Actinomycetota bacterium]
MGVGILVASLSFTLLTAAVNTGELQLRGTITRNFRSSYDILVRPADSFTDLERSQGLVADNFASGIFGGITRAQWRETLAIPGVEVAAPIANLGYVAPFVRVTFGIEKFLNDDPVQLYRIRSTWSADRDLSNYPGQDSFVYYTRENRMFTPRHEAKYELLPNGDRLPVGSGFNQGVPLGASSPFVYSTPEGWFIQCFSERSPQAARVNTYPLGPGEVGSGTDVLYPALVAAIDPVQEEQLLGVKDSIVSGRFLLPTDEVGGKPGDRIVPMIAGSRTYVDQPMDAVVERLRIPRGVSVPRTLASPDAFRFVTRLDGEDIGSVHLSSKSLFYHELHALARGAGGLQNYWAVGPIRYEGDALSGLSPTAVRNPDDAYTVPCCGPLAAPGNQDTQFRSLDNHQRPYLLGEPSTAFHLDIVGRFDPERITGAGMLSEVPLGAYAPPVLEGADARSRALLQDQPLLPSMNLGGYIQQPPLLLTTLQGLRFFTNPSNFERADRDAPISVIRVRVAGVTGPDDLSLARIRSVAQLIRQRTGLAVDIVAGSSPSPVVVDLPAGQYGRPPLQVREAWAKKGVAVTIIQALDRKSLLLFILVLLVTGFFLANGALAAVRSRRSEIGALACFGWSRGRIFLAILGELVLIGLGAGVIGTALALAASGALSVEVPVSHALLVTPVAVALACVAGIVPAWQASRIEPVEALRAPVSRRASSGSIRGLVGMAVVNLRRLPGRTIVGAGGLFIGVAALTVLLSVNWAFRGALVGSLLGNVISVQVRGVDVLSVCLALGLSSLCIADVLVLNIRERAAELVTLRATGWDGSRLARLIAFEGLGLGLLGSIPGAIAGVAFAWALGGVSAEVVAAGAVAAATAVGIALVASLVPAAFVSRMLAPIVLAEE